MSEPGYVYALINPSLEGLVKIGKTTDDPEARARELSAATGVPTPFVVVYHIYVEDCSRAEEQLHLLLELKGHRISETREFFRATVKDVIDMMQGVERCAVSGSMDAEESKPKSGNPDTSSRERLMQQLVEEADAYFNGSGDHLEDDGEAMRLYERAAKLGSADACSQLGFMYEIGFGENKDVEKALDYYKEAVRLGDDYAFIRMARIYESEMMQMENAWKCWKKYLKSPSFQNSPNRVESAFAVLIKDHKIDTFPPDVLHVLSPIKSDLIEFIRTSCMGKSTREIDDEFLTDIEKIKNRL